MLIYVAVNVTENLVRKDTIYTLCVPYWPDVDAIVNNVEHIAIGPFHWWE